MKIDIFDAKWPIWDYESLGNKWLNLGCGRVPLPGFINVDKFDGPGVDQLIDIEKADLPWPDDYFDYIYISHVLEHIPHRTDGINGEAFYSIFDEILRVLKIGGILEVKAPYHKDPNTLADVGHTRLININTFYYWMESEKVSNDALFYINSGKYLKLVKRKMQRAFNFGPITAYHFRKYLKIEFGSSRQMTWIFKIVEKGDATRV